MPRHCTNAPQPYGMTWQHLQLCVLPTWSLVHGPIGKMYSFCTASAQQFMHCSGLVPSDTRRSVGVHGRTERLLQHLLQHRVLHIPHTPPHMYMNNEGESYVALTGYGTCRF